MLFEGQIHRAGLWPSVLFASIQQHIRYDRNRQNILSRLLRLGGTYDT